MIEQLINPVSDILDKFVADKDLKLKLSHELEKEIVSLNKLQIELNKEDAKGHWFQSSWRPATAWVCVAGFAINFLISPLAAPFGIQRRTCPPRHQRPLGRHTNLESLSF